MKPASGCAEAAREPVRSVSPLAVELRIGVLTRAGTGEGALLVALDVARGVVVGRVEEVEDRAAVGCCFVAVSETLCLAPLLKVEGGRCSMGLRTVATGSWLPEVCGGLRWKRSGVRTCAEAWSAGVSSISMSFISGCCSCALVGADGGT